MYLEFVDVASRSDVDPTRGIVMGNLSKKSKAE